MEKLKQCETCREDCPQAQMAHDSAMARMYATQDLAKCAPYWDGLFDDAGSPEITPDRLRELAQADREGRVVVLPCKVGDTAFVLESEDEDGGDDYIFAGNIVAIHIGEGGITVAIGHMEHKCWFSEAERRASDLNIDWFLTREEAEKALEAQKGAEDEH